MGIWEWEDSRYEQAIPTAIGELPDPDTDPELALIVRDAILPGADRRLTARLIGDAPLWGYESCANLTSDLCLIDASNQIRVVIEHKCGASPNVGFYPNFNALARFDDQLAMSVPARPDDLDDAPGARGQRRLWQTDYYRYIQDWIRPLDTGEPPTGRRAEPPVASAVRDGPVQGRVLPDRAWTSPVPLAEKRSQIS